MWYSMTFLRNYCDKASHYPDTHCLGDDDRVARVLFGKHPRAQGGWWSQKPEAASQKMPK